MPCGDLGTRWSTTYQICVAGERNTACNELEQQTCVLARTRPRLRPNLMSIQQIKDEGMLPTAELHWAGILYTPAEVMYVGEEWAAMYEGDNLRVGDRIIALGNQVLTDELLAGLADQTEDITVTIARDQIVKDIVLCGPQEE